MYSHERVFYLVCRKIIRLFSSDKTSSDILPSNFYIYLNIWYFRQSLSNMVVDFMSVEILSIVACVCNVALWPCANSSKGHCHHHNCIGIKAVIFLHYSKLVLTIWKSIFAFENGHLIYWMWCLLFLRSWKGFLSYFLRHPRSGWNFCFSCMPEYLSFIIMQNSGGRNSVFWLF